MMGKRALWVLVALGSSGTALAQATKPVKMFGDEGAKKGHSTFRAQPVAAPDCCGMERIPGATSHQPPRQVSLIVRP